MRIIAQYLLKRPNLESPTVTKIPMVSIEFVKLCRYSAENKKGAKNERQRPRRSEEN